MAASTSLVLNISSDRKKINEIVGGAGEDQQAAIDLVNFIQAGISGNENLSIDVSYDDDAAPVKASTFITLTAAVGAGETYTIDGVVLTEGSEFVGQVSVTADALAIATAVNAQAVIGTYITAVPVAGVITFTSNIPGVIGNTFTVATNDASTTVDNATFENGAGGAENTPVTLSLGL